MTQGNSADGVPDVQGHMIREACSCLNMAGTERDSFPRQAVINPAAQMSGMRGFPLSVSTTYICEIPETIT